MHGPCPLEQAGKLRGREAPVGPHKDLLPSWGSTGPGRGRGLAHPGPQCEGGEERATRGELGQGQLLRAEPTLSALWAPQSLLTGSPTQAPARATTWDRCTLTEGQVRDKIAGQAGLCAQKQGQPCHLHQDAVRPGRACPPSGPQEGPTARGPGTTHVLFHLLPPAAFSMGRAQAQAQAQAEAPSVQDPEKGCFLEGDARLWREWGASSPWQ